MSQYKISVIIPTYNVEDYVDECINSLIHQTMKEFEIIVVDDGSTDNTCFIFDKYKKYIPNLNIYKLPHSGSPGGSRNFGVNKARGQYIFFLDPDDTLPYDALQIMYESIQKSGSDIVIGNSCQFNSKNKWTLKDISEKVFYNERITTFEEEPYLFSNFSAWNKLYNIDFIRNNKIKFTENIRYGEDKEFVLKAYYLAEKIHVIPDTIYYYRRRDNTSNVSATQSYEIEIFKQNVETIEICSEIAKRFSKNDDFERLFFHYRIEFDFLRFIDYYFLNCFEDKKLINEVCSLSARIIDLMGNWGELDLTFPQKAKLYLLKEQRLDELKKFIQLQKKNLVIYKLEVSSRSVIAKGALPGFEKFKFPKEIMQSNCELKLEKSIEHLSFRNGSILVRGWAILKKVNSEIQKIKKYLVLKNANGDRIERSLQNTRRSDITLKKGLGIYNYNWSGFEGSVDFGEILTNQSNWNNGVEIWLKVSVEDLSIEEKITEYPSMPRVRIIDLKGNENISYITGIHNIENQKCYSIKGFERKFKEHEVAFFPENKIIQRVEQIVYSEKDLNLKGWAIIPNIDLLYYHSVRKKLIFINAVTNEEFTFDTKNTKNLWPNKQFEINPFGFRYDYSGWEVTIPCLALPEGIYDIYIEVEAAGYTVREKLKYPSADLLKKRHRLEQTYITFSRRFTTLFSGSEHCRESVGVRLHIQFFKEYDQIEGGYLPLIGIKSDYWSVTSGPHILLKKIAVDHNNLTFSGTALLNQVESPGNQKYLLLVNTNNNKVYFYRCNNYIFDFGDENNKFSGWIASIPYSKLEDGEYILRLRIVSSDHVWEEPIISIYGSLLRNKDVWGRSHYINQIKIDFKISKNIAYQNKYNIRFTVTRTRQNLIDGYVIKAKRKIRSVLKKSITKIKSRTKKNNIVKAKLKKLIPINISSLSKRAKNKLKSMVYVKSYDIFKLLPINKKKIVFATYRNNLAGNLAYIHEGVIERKLDKKCVCLFGNEKSLRELLITAYHLATASTVLIEDYYRHLYPLRHRKKTKFIQTWHATGVFKRFGMLAVDKKETFGEEFEKKAHAYYTHVLVSGTEMVDPYAKAFNISKDKVYPIGIPRTDIFFNKEKIEKVKEYIYNLYPQLKNKRVILYTPTFRGDYKQRKFFRNELDFNAMQVLREKGYLLLYKTHPNVIEPIIIPDRLKDFVIDVSLYPEINELFFVTDILITDYSTTIFEFALLNKPIIAYAYDLDTYIDERGFYYDYDFIIPGPIFKTTEDIVEYICNLKSLYVDHTKFLKHFMDGVDGNSTDRVLDLILY